MRKVSGSLVVLFVVALGLLAWLVTHLDRPLPGVTYVGLALGCRVEIYDTRVVLERTVRIACPGQAIINVWPPPKGKLWCQDCVTNFFSQLDWSQALPEINLP